MKPQQSHVRRERAQTALAVVGVDAGKFHHALVVRPQGRADSSPFVFPTTRLGFDAAVSFIQAQIGTPPSVPRGGDRPGVEILVGIEFEGMYGFTFAHYLRALEATAAVRFGIVSVLPAHTKRWKEVTHRQPLKTDAKDAVGITDLTAQGHYVTFPYLAPAYAELRYLLSARERLSTLRRGVITRVRTSLDVVFPEFTQVFAEPARRTARAMLRAFPGPEALRAAPRRRVLAVLRRESRNHLGAATYERLLGLAAQTVALPGAQGAMKDELPLLVDRLALYEAQMHIVESAMRAQLAGLPPARALLTIPNVAPVTAAVFLGSVGDPAAYDSARQIIALAGLTLVERSSGILHGEKRISKRGRPTLRKHAHMFAVRSVRTGGIFRAEYDALLARNGHRTIPALTAIARKGLRLLFAVARDGRPWTAAPPPAGRPAEPTPASTDPAAPQS